MIYFMPKLVWTKIPLTHNLVIDKTIHITFLTTLTTYLKNTSICFINCHRMGLKVDIPISLS